MITNQLPWIAVALAVVALVARDGMWTSRPLPASDGRVAGDRRTASLSLAALWVAILFALVALAGGWQGRHFQPGIWPSALAFAVGVSLACLCSVLSWARLVKESLLAAPLGLAVGALGLVSLIKPPDLEPAQIGLVLGLAVGAWIVDAANDSPDWASRAAAFAGVIALADILGRRAPGGSSDFTGLMLAGAGVAVLIAISFARTRKAGGRPGLGGVWLMIFAALLFAAGWLVASRYVWIGNVWRVFGGAVVLAYLVHLTTSRDMERTSLRFALAAAAWVGAGTLAFAYLRGYGMSLALLGGALVFLAADNRPMLLSLGPLAALVAYRVFREAHLSASRALDLGQHYALVGLLAGAALVVAALEYRRALPSGSPVRSATGNAFVALTAIGTPVFAIALLAEKGTIGLLVGFGVGVFVAGLQKEDRPIALALPMSLSLATVSIFSFSETLLDLTRPEKLAFLYWSVPPMLVIAFVLVLLVQEKLSRPPAEAVQAPEGAAP